MIEGYEHDFLHTPVDIAPGYKFDQLATVKQAQMTYAGKFSSGNKDEMGYKYFYNLVKPRVKNAAKNLDVDTKDINIRATSPENYYKAWIMRRDMKQWLRKRDFGVVLNDMVMLTPKYGTFVLKKVGGKEIVRRVDLKNLKNDPTCNSLAESQWIIEDHFYTPVELRKEVARGWYEDAITKAIDSYRATKKENYVDNHIERDNVQGDAQYIHVKEFCGEVPKKFITENENDTGFILATMIVISPDGGTKTQAGEEERKGLVLYKRELKEIPYKEVHFDREEGRWLGVGLAEDLRDMQILKNEQINQVVLGLRLANLILFQTNDETIARNVLTDLVNGDIIKAKGTIERINTTNIGLGTDQVISQEINTIVNDLSNSFEVTTGQNMPSGTPFSLGALINQNANKLFDFYREKIGLFLQDVFEEWIIPELSKDLNKEHLLEITDKEEMQWIIERMTQSTTWDTIKRFVLTKGRRPTQAEVDLAAQVIEERLSAGENMFLDIPKDFYNFEKTVEVDITGESLDKSAQLTTLSSLLQILGQNPEMAEHPITQEILDLSGKASIDVQRGVKTAPAAPQAMPTPQPA